MCARPSYSHVDAGRIPPVVYVISLEGFITRVWPYGHAALHRDLSMRRRAPLPFKDVRVPAGSCLVFRYDVPHSGGLYTNVRLSGSIGHSQFPRPYLRKGSLVHADDVSVEECARAGLLAEAAPLQLAGSGRREQSRTA
jgi:hypothetical protein